MLDADKEKKQKDTSRMQSLVSSLDKVRHSLVTVAAYGMILDHEYGADSWSQLSQDKLGSMQTARFGATLYW